MAFAMTIISIYVESYYKVTSLNALAPVRFESLDGVILELILVIGG